MTEQDKQMCRQALLSIKELVGLLERVFNKQMSVLPGTPVVASTDNFPGSAGAKLAELAAAAKQNLQKG